MNISELSTSQKSVMLARLVKEDMLPGKYMPVMSPEFKPVNLYDPANMALAWRVLNWAMSYPMPDDESYQFVAKLNFSLLWGDVMRMPPAEAQAAWLDRILELAVESGMVKDG